ncbi:NYN domain-containing protein [Candidatus Thorarchaeota archaeon]|nr:MAG: NYN domain-containing protein [Candidatus Thorarchaeota archaeon]
MSDSEIRLGLAVFWDVENVHDILDTHVRMTDAIRKSGRVIKAFAFADWDTRRRMAENLHQLGYDLIHVPDSKDNAADYKMASYIMDHVVHYPESQQYVMITGDGDFNLIAGALRERGFGLWVISNPIITSSALSELATKYNDIFSFRPVHMDCSTPEDCDVSSGRLSDYRRRAGMFLREAIQKIRNAGQKPGMGHVKHVMNSLNPQFDESVLGFSTWSEFVDWAESERYVERGGEPPNIVLEIPSEEVPETAQLSLELQSAFDSLLAAVEQRLERDESTSLSDVKADLKAEGVDHESLGYMRFNDLILAAEKRGMIRVFAAGEGEENITLLPQCTVDRVKEWFESNVTELFGKSVKIPKAVFLEKISQMLLENRATLKHLETYLRDEDVKRTYEGILKASGIPFLPPYQMSMAYVMLGRGKSVDETVASVNEELEPLGISLKGPE